MGQVRHGSATTTHAVRAAIQRSQASLAALSKELGINPKTVAKWRKRATVEDQKTGPKEPRSSVLTEAEEATVVAFRRHTLLPLDDCLYALQPTIPHLTRSSLHRCLQRHDISRLPEVDGDKPKRQRFKRYPIGFFHIDIAEVQTAEGKLYLFVAIDRTSKFAVAQLVETADRRTAWEFLERVLEAVPYKIHTILTDNGIQFAEQPRNRNTITSRPMRFDMICTANDIEHWLGRALGGQGALIAFAGLVALVVPVNALAVRQLRRRERAGLVLAPTPPGTLQAALKKPAFWMIAASFMAVYLNHGILITYVLVLFADRGVEAGLAALAAAAIGPSQVAGRLILLAAGARVSTAQATIAALCSVVVAGALLWLAGAAPVLIFVFSLAQGAGLGLTSILRPVLIAEILGRQGFGAISGAAAVAPILASAAAPSVGAGLLTFGGPELVYAVCLALAGLGLALMLVLLARWRQETG